MTAKAPRQREFLDAGDVPEVGDAQHLWPGRLQLSVVVLSQNTLRKKQNTTKHAAPFFLSLHSSTLSLTRACKTCFFFF